MVDAPDSPAQAAEGALSRGEFTTLKTWLEELPPEVLQARSDLSLYYAWSLTLNGQVEAASQVLENRPDEIGREDSEAIHSEMAALQSLIAVQQINIDRFRDLIGPKLDHLPQTNPFFRGLKALLQGLEYDFKAEIEPAMEGR